MFWPFITSLVAFAIFMLVLALGMMLGRRKTQCSCKTAARVMAAKMPTRCGADDSPFRILDNDPGGCQCGDET